MITRQQLQEAYTDRYEKTLKPLAARIQSQLDEFVRPKFKRIDRISARAKSIDRFLDKALKLEGGQLKYTDPLNEITDQIGARIVTFYIKDVETVRQIVNDYFAKIEELRLEPAIVNQINYEGRHFTLFIPDDLKAGLPEDHCPTFFRLQIQTL